MDFRDLYKILRAPTFTESLGKRTQNVIAVRQEKQREHFWSKRVQSQTSPLMEQIPVEKKKNARAELLKKWKEEKLKKMEEEKKNKKPIFKVGVVHRKATGSPLLANAKTERKKAFPVAPKKGSPIKIEKNFGEGRQGMITRSKARNIKGLNIDKKLNPVEIRAMMINNEKATNKFCKIESGKKKTFQSHGFNVPKSVSELPYCNKLTYPYSPKMLKNSGLQISKQKEIKEENLKTESDEIEKRAEKVEENSIQLEAVEEKVNVQVQICQKETEAERNEPKPSPSKANTTPQKSPAPGVPDTDNFVPIYYSPFVTVRRSRKSGKKAKKSLSMDVDEQIEKEEKEFRCRIFSFRKYIECETKRLLDDSNKWRRIYQDFQEIPSDVEGEIDSIIGKTNLLTSDKFKQFKDLIDKCEGGDPLIKIDDLQGFQDWVSIEVDKLDEDFRKLEIRKCNNWVSETVEIDKVKAKKTTINKNPAKRPVGKSNIRSHILAARKLLKEGNLKASPGCKFPIFSNEDPLKIGTPIKKSSLLREVLNSSTKKKSEDCPVVKERRNSGLEIMIATQKTKFSSPVKTVSNITSCEVFVNENQTPSRGILKKAPRTVNSSKANVKFHEDPENGARGLEEKYLLPSNNEENSPFRVVLGDLKNSASRMSTRSQTRLAASMERVN